ncbi:MAG: GNAT family N-acetyltransferase [Tissierellaceae bacterium]|nr:GNAT family N-acetyltransferase [Tissierellaceae bacterium]
MNTEEITMREIRKLNETHIDAYTDIAFNAYPSFKDFTEEAMNKYKETVAYIMNNDSAVTFYGMFEDEKLIAVMRLFDFKMNCFGKIVPASGLGFLGVHLMHKKEKAAKAMVEFYEKTYRDKGIPIGALLPFRPDFYKKMGYGIGSKMNQYRLPPNRMPLYSGKSDLRYVAKNEFDMLLKCHERVVAKTHGMMMKIGDEIRNLTSDPYNRIVGSYDENGNINGYIIYKFQNAKAGNYTVTNIYVKELIYENTDVLRKFLGFLRKQDDEIDLIIFNTEDEYFYYLFDNPLNDSLNYIPYGYIESNTQAVGVMYKLFDIKKAFEQCSHRNYGNSNLNVRFLISDELSKNVNEIIVNFKDGKAHTNAEKYDVTAKIRTSDFSSLFLASVSIMGLYNLGLIKLDKEEYLDELDRTFYYAQKPVCYTDF